MIEVWVPGHPKPKGSLEADGSMRQSVAGSEAWGRMIASVIPDDQCRAQGPMRVDAAFWLEAPPTRAKRSEIARFWAAPVWSGTGNGDLDKLIRNALDAATGRAYANDVQVVEIHAWKWLCREGQKPGALLRIRFAPVDVPDAVRVTFEAKRVILGG